MPVDPDIAQKVIAFLDNNVLSCAACESRADGEYVWRGPTTDLIDLVWDENFGLDDDEIEEVLCDYCCPNCGAELSATEEVSYKTLNERRSDDLLKRACDPAMRDRLHLFSSFLSKYPYLGACDPAETGKQIIESISVAQRTNLFRTQWFRARLLNSDSRLYDAEEMGPPDPELVFIKEGRYNHTGQSFLYASEARSIALEEVSLTGKENVCAIQEYRLAGVTNILDLTRAEDGPDPNMTILQAAIIYNGFVETRPGEKTSWKPEYFVPRFLSDVARHEGFGGILFSSAVADGDNLVLFSYDPVVCTKVGNSQLYCKQP